MEDYLRILPKKGVTERLEARSERDNSYNLFRANLQKPDITIYCELSMKPV